MNNLSFDVQRFAKISNSTNNTVITGTADADSINNYGDNVTINAGAGNDSIYNRGDNVTINAGEGNDSIRNYDDNVTINADAGNDSIRNYGDNFTIYGGAGDDSIYNYSNGSTVTIDASGNYIYSGNGYIATIDGGVGNDYIYNGYVTQEGYGWYREHNYYDSNGIPIPGLPAPDYYFIETIYGGNLIMFGGEGNDTVQSVDGNNVTLSGGNGDDILIGNNGNYKDVFIYNSGNDTIQSFKSGEILSFAATYTGWAIDNNDLIINAAEGSVRITDAKNKLVEIAGGDGNVFAHAFIASGYEGALDYRNDNIFEVLVGSDNLSNQIYAGTGGSSLYGGFGGNDELHGGAGYDEFVYKYGDGQDTIFNASVEDVVNINSILPEQIAGAEITDNGVNATFIDGGSLNINGQAGAFILDGQRFGADYQTKTWYVK